MTGLDASLAKPPGLRVESQEGLKQHLVELSTRHRVELRVESQEGLKQRRGAGVSRGEAGDVESQEGLKLDHPVHLFPLVVAV